MSKNKKISAFISKKDSNSLFVFCNSCGRKGFYNVNAKKKSTTTESKAVVGQSNVKINQFSNEIIQRLTTTGEYDVENH